MRTNKERISVAVKIDSGQSRDMCGRYTRYLTWGEIHALYRLTAPAGGPGRNTEARYNIAPTQTVDFITWGDDGNHKLRGGRWWLVNFFCSRNQRRRSGIMTHGQDQAPATARQLP